ncbi:acyl-CoA dehydrogenase family protein [Nocardia sp. X0981]
MSGEFGEFHDELRTVARELLGRSGDVADWTVLARAGWTGLEVAAEHGGAAATFAETAILLEEVGRAAVRTAYPSVAAAGVGVLELLEPNARRDAELRATVAGTAVPVTVLAGDMVPAAGGETACAGTGGIVPTFRLTQTTANIHLSGSAAFVPDAPVATTLLVPAQAPDGAAHLVCVEPGTPGVRVTGQEVVDTTRNLGRVTADEVVVAPDSVLSFRGDPRRALRTLYDRAALAVACDGLGIAAAMLDTTVGYVRVRTQFDRPIGSFQAVKHACADMLVDLTLARRLVGDAVSAVTGGAPESGRAVAMAKAYTGEAAVRIAGKALQLHGGIGYTWDSGIHRYLKRATLGRVLYGAPAEHRGTLTGRYRRT